MKEERKVAAGTSEGKVIAGTWAGTQMEAMDEAAVSNPLILPFLFCVGMFFVYAVVLALAEPPHQDAEEVIDTSSFQQP